MAHAHSTHILVTLDEPAIAPEVAHVVQHLASPAGADVTLLRVLVPARDDLAAPTGDIVPLLDLAEHRARVQLVHAGAALQDVRIRPEVIVGRDVAREILLWLSEHAVDWVVMAARDRRGLRRLFGRGVIETVRAASPAPVLSVHPARTRRQGRIIIHPAAFGARPAEAT
jgi:nucleotide-binding universal stress UspA family protein